MGSLYLIDTHSAVLANSKINDTVSSPAGFATDIPIRGSFVVNVPFDVPLDGIPQDLGDLITKKYLGILAMYPGYQNILFDEQIDSVGWVFPPTLGGSVAIGTMGNRQTNSVVSNGTLESGTTVLASNPQTCVLRWEAFEYTYDDTTSVQGQRNYREADPDWFVVLVSFNGGSTWNIVQNGLIFSIPLVDQGANFRIAFQRTGPIQKLYLGSWALVY
jgi:hypothetical protein